VGFSSFGVWHTSAFLPTAVCPTLFFLFKDNRGAKLLITNMEREIIIELQKIQKKLERIDKKLTVSFPEKRETWVKVSIITEITGWTAQKMFSARKNQVIKWKKTNTGFWYLLESVPTQLWKKELKFEIKKPS
jgi:hypothetical protein